MFTRRDFLKAGAVAGAAVMLPWGCGSSGGVGKTYPDSIPDNITKYIDPLPLPLVLQPARFVDGGPYYEVLMSECRQQLHSQFPLTTLWGYNGMYPGPTIETRKNQKIKVEWINNLPNTNKHLLDYAYDAFLHGANMGEPRVRAVVHLHGGHVPPESDGWPLAWITPGNSALFDYPNLQNGTTLWYHDHALGITRLNVYAGLAGFYIIRDDFEDSLNLPKGIYEIPLVIQDRAFNKDGSLSYTVRNPAEIPTSSQHPGPWVPEFFGNVILVNGKVWPYLEVEARKYRFRILNGSNARFYNLTLGGLNFDQIGSDGGLFISPVKLASILLAPAERADVIVDFSGFAGQSIIMTNNAPDGPFTGVLDPSDIADPNTTGQIMLFKVKNVSDTDTSTLPLSLASIVPLTESSAALTRDFTLEEIVDQADEPIGLEINHMDFDEPIVDKPAVGSVEVWRLINLTGDTHPMHVHLVMFQVLDRQPFDAERYLSALEDFRRGMGPAPMLEDFYSGPAVLPAESEMGWKDTVKANPGEITRIIMRFEDFKGKYPFHCHILEHEDNAMMIAYEVV